MANAENAGGENRELDILLIENDPATAHLTKEAFREAGFFDRVTTVADGDEALAYLRHERRYAGRRYPDLIFLDLHLPRKSGFDVLTELKANPKLLATPVIVISGSANPADIRKAYELHASCYVRKSENLDEFLNFIRICFSFWGEVVVLPEKPDLAEVTR